MSPRAPRPRPCLLCSPRCLPSGCRGGARPTPPSGSSPQLLSRAAPAGSCGRKRGLSPLPAAAAGGGLFLSLSVTGCGCCQLFSDVISAIRSSLMIGSVDGDQESW
ncbi:uncharacterized protein ACIGJ3_015956 [Trichechus inunguis]